MELPENVTKKFCVTCSSYDNNTDCLNTCPVEGSMEKKDWKKGTPLCDSCSLQEFTETDEDTGDGYYTCPNGRDVIEVCSKWVIRVELIEEVKPLSKYQVQPQDVIDIYNNIKITVEAALDPGEFLMVEDLINAHIEHLKGLE